MADVKQQCEDDPLYINYDITPDETEYKTLNAIDDELNYRMDRTWDMIQTMNQLELFTEITSNS